MHSMFNSKPNIQFVIRCSNFKFKQHVLIYYILMYVFLSKGVRGNVYGGAWVPGPRCLGRHGSRTRVHVPQVPCPCPGPHVPGPGSQVWVPGPGPWVGTQAPGPGPRSRVQGPVLFISECFIFLCFLKSSNMHTNTFHASFLSILPYNKKTLGFTHNVGGREFP